jgi:hypothetical protein
MNKPVKIVSVIVLVVVAIAGVFWWTSLPAETDRDLAEFKAVLAENQPEKQRNDALKQTFEKQTDGMTDEQKAEYVREKLLPFIVMIISKGVAAGYDKVMALPPNERTRELDRVIDELSRNKPPANQQPQGPSPTPEQVEAFRVKMLDLISPVERTKVENGLKMLEKRMKERGLSPPPGWGGQF